MKRSDYEAKSRRFWMDSVTPPMEAAWIPGWLEKYVANDVRAAEAAGVVWDPEAEPLPEKLYKADLGRGRARVLADGDNGYTARELTHREADEVKRRYEAWPELLRLLEDYNGGGWTSELFRRLEEILRGA